VTLPQARPAPATPRGRRVSVAAALTLAGVLIAGCGAGSSESGTPAVSGIAAAPAPTSGDAVDLTIPAGVQALPLVDQDGKTVTLASLTGRTVVVTPSLTLCQEFCPLISANIGLAQRAVAASGLSGKVTFLEVTVDPARDNQAHLKAYQSLYGAEANWEFLRGSAAQVAAFWGAFHLSYGKAANDPGNRDPHDWLTGAPITFDVSHQNILYVLGADGHIKWLTEAAPNVGSAPLPDKLRVFLDTQGVHNYTSPDAVSWTVADLDRAIAYVTGAPVRPAAG
jgi:cytochrome oxidase Cu insertion factor (SCO1/SenC/PrrC family)